MNEVAENGTVAEIRCPPGHLFEDKTNVHLARCDGIFWNYTDGECTRKHILRYPFHNQYMNTGLSFVLLRNSVYNYCDLFETDNL